MDFGLPVGIFIVIFAIVWICVYCCVKKSRTQGTVYGVNGVPVTGTVTQPTPIVNPPYPLDPGHPTPQMMSTGFVTTPYPPPSAPGFDYLPHSQGTGITPYPPRNVTPYPPATGAPYPPSGPVYPPTGAPYPPRSAAPPPSYLEAVSQPSVNPLPNTNKMYSRQAPYNPNF